MANLTAFEVKGTDELRKLLERAIRRNYPSDIREAIKPGAMLIRNAAREEAPKDTGKLSRSVILRSSRTRPVVMVAVDRKKALRKSKKFPTGFPYVNSVISEKRRGPKADKFVTRAVDKTESAALDLMEKEMLKLLDGIFS